MGKEDLLMIAQGILNMAGVVALVYFKLPVEQIVMLLGALNGLSIAKHTMDMKNGKKTQEIEERLATLEAAVAQILKRV